MQRRRIDNHQSFSHCQIWRRCKVSDAAEAENMIVAPVTWTMKSVVRDAKWDTEATVNYSIHTKMAPYVAT